MLFLPLNWTYEARLPLEARIPGFRDSAVPVINGIGKNIVCSFTPQCEPEEPASVPGCCTSAFCYIYMVERLGYGLRSRVGLTSRDFKDPGACLRNHTTD